MATLNFPSDPSTQNPVNTYSPDSTPLASDNGVTYVWDGEKWTANSGGGNLDDVYVNVNGDTMTGDLTVPSLNGGPLAGFRNQFINGNFQINQRNEDTLTSGGFLFDRWYWDGTGSYTRGLNTPLGQARSASFADGSTGRLQQAVELPETGKSGPFINGSQWTLSLYVKQGSFADLATGTLDVFFRRSSTSGTDAVRAVNPAPSFTATSETSNGFTRYVCTFTIDADPHSTSECITFRFPIQSAIGAVQLEPGPVATPFEHRPIGTELALCQRYFYKASQFNYRASNSPNASPARVHYTFPTTMRTGPTVDYTGSTVTLGDVVNYGTPTIDNMTMNISTTGTIFDGTINFTADAEL